MAEKCPMCGAPMESNSCDYCGYKVETPEPETVEPEQPQMENAVFQSQFIFNNQMIPNVEIMPTVSEKKRVVALLLCLFFGMLGIHRFYVGKVGTGILYIFTWGLVGIGWLFDLIMIALGCFRDKSGLPLQ